MKQNIKVEPMALADAPEMADWMAKLAHRNNLDADVLGYRATTVMKASNGKALVYVPVQTVYMWESLALNPEASPLEIASALRALFTVVEYEGRKAGHGEQYFLCADEETCKFAEHQGLEKIEGLTLYRRKL